VKRRTHRDTDTLAQRLMSASRVIPSILDHLDEQRANITTLSSPTSDGPGSKGGHSDPTLRTVTALEAINLHNRAINDQVHCVKVAVDLLDEACRDALGHRAPKKAAQEEPLCDGGDPSSWGDVQCGDIVESRQMPSHVWYHASGLCPRHRRRMERWQRSQAA